MRQTKSFSAMIRKYVPIKNPTGRFGITHEEGLYILARVQSAKSADTKTELISR